MNGKSVPNFETRPRVVVVRLQPRTDSRLPQMDCLDSLKYMNFEVDRFICGVEMSLEPLASVSSLGGRFWTSSLPDSVDFIGDCTSIK